jgi:hypothetical protein
MITITFITNGWKPFNLHNMEKIKLEKVVLSMAEIRMATRPNIYKNKKKYTRKPKHKVNELHEIR